MLKNMKIGKKISLFITILLVAGLTILSVIVIVNLRSSMKDQANDRFSELADARANVVDTYFAAYKEYVSGFAAQGIVRDYLKDPSNETALQAASRGIKDYYGARKGMEGLFVLNTNGECVVHTNNSVVGKTIIQPGDLETYKNNIAKNAWIKGIAPATATGELVAVCYSGAYDENGTFLGYIGGGAYITSLTDRIKSMELNGLDNVDVWLLNLNVNNYVFVPDKYSDLLGQEFSREVDKKIASEASSNPRDTFDFKDDDGKYTVAYKLIPNLNYVVVVSAPESEVMATASSTARIIIIISVIILILMAALTIFIGTSIGKEIAGVGEVIKDLGTLDLTKADKLRPYTGRKDEIGVIADAATTLTGAVRDSVRSLTERADQLRSESDLLSENTLNTLNSLNQIDKAVHDVADGATSQSVETQHASDAVTSIGGMVEDTIRSAGKLKTAAESLQLSSGKAKDILGELSAINERTKVSVNDIYQQTNETNSSAERISEATALISSISDQTNLLSLNASIEAARAGEAGRGFAVVAEEIGHLAVQSSESASQIENIIAALVDSSKKAVATMDKVREIMEQQNDYIQRTKDIFGDVDKEISNSMSQITEISKNVKELDSARRTLADSVSSLSAIAEENAASTEETSASTSVVNRMMGDVSGIADRVSNVANNIKNDVDVYNI